MNAKFYPQVLSGTTEAQALKPLAMRYLVLAFCAKGESKIYIKNETEDFTTLKDALVDLGVSVNRSNSVYTVSSPEIFDTEHLELNFKDSASALRLLLPSLTTRFEHLDFTANARLVRKNYTAGMHLLKGVSFGSKGLPNFTGGKLEYGEFVIEPDINSNLACGIIMALPLLKGDSVVRFTEKPKKQLSYLIDLTLFAMREFGVNVEREEDIIKICGGKQYVAPQQRLTVEGDYNVANYFLAANSLGGKVTVENLKENTLQPEKNIPDYFLAISKQGEIDLKGKTDFVFLLTAIASAMNKRTTFNKFKLKDKDKQKFQDFIGMLTRLGARINLEEDKLIVIGKEKLCGGIMLDSLGDARVAMSLIVLSCRMQEPVTILSVESAFTEQASFINEFIRLGGKCEVV